MGEQTRDPVELWIVLHKTGSPASAWSEQAAAEDAAYGWSAHASCYVPKSELEAARAELELARAEVQGLYEAFRGSGHSPKNPREAAQAIGQLRDAEIDGELARAAGSQLAAALQQISEWDVISPPSSLVADSIWLRNLVDSALAAYKGRQGASNQPTPNHEQRSEVRR